MGTKVIHWSRKAHQALEYMCGYDPGMKSSYVIETDYGKEYLANFGDVDITPYSLCPQCSLLAHTEGK